MTADPQHPAVPFEQAVDLLTGEPRQLRPQHPDIAALVEELGGYANLLRMLHPKQNEKSAALVDRTIAALRTLARPVEPIEPVEPTEPTAEDEEMVAGLIGFLRDDLAPACQREGCRLARPVEDEEVAKWLRRFNAYGGEFEEAASLLARLAREKVNAEQERDHLHRAHVLAAEDAARRLEQATRAEQEAARLRDAVAEARRLIGFVTTATDAAAARVLERALAAAAGAEG